MTKFKLLFEQMHKENKDAFDSFSWVHEKYTEDESKWQRTFNIEGGRILDIIRHYENILCGKSERGGYGKFTTKLSEKFWDEIRKAYPKINRVGIISG